MRAIKATFAVLLLLLASGVFNAQNDAPPAPEGEFAFSDIGFGLGRGTFEIKGTIFTQGDRVGVEFRVKPALQPGSSNFTFTAKVEADDGSIHEFSYEPLALSRRREVAKLGEKKAAGDDIALKGFAGAVTASEADCWTCVVWIDPAVIGRKLTDTFGFGFSAINGSSVGWYPGDVRDAKLTQVNLKNVESRAQTGEHPAAVALAREARVVAAYLESGQADTDALSIDTLTRAHERDPTDIALVFHLIKLFAPSHGSFPAVLTDEASLTREKLVSRLLALCPGWYSGHSHELMRLLRENRFEEAADYFELWQQRLPRTRDHPEWDSYFNSGCRALGRTRRWKAVQKYLDQLDDRDYGEGGVRGVFVAAEMALGAGQDDFATSLRDRLLKQYSDKHTIHAWWLEAMVACGRYAEALKLAKQQLGDYRALDLSARREQAARQFVLAASMAFDPPEAAEACTNTIKDLELMGRTREILEEYSVLCKHADKSWQEELQFRRNDAEKQNPRVKVQTDQGTFVIELFEDDAPNTVANFVALVREGFYAGRSIYRREACWLVQGGGRDDSTTGSSEDWTIANEASQRRHWRGSIAMARALDKDSGNTHFFITIGNQPQALELSTDWVVFGRITEGLEAAQRLQVGDRIQNAQAENLRDHDYQPVRLPAKKD